MMLLSFKKISKGTTYLLACLLAMGIAFFQEKIQGHPSIACKGHDMTLLSFKKNSRMRVIACKGALLSFQKISRTSLLAMGALLRFTIKTQWLPCLPCRLRNHIKLGKMAQVFTFSNFLFLILPRQKRRFLGEFFGCILIWGSSSTRQGQV
jgi:hypothetical protein